MSFTPATEPDSNEIDRIIAELLPDTPDGPVRARRIRQALYVAGYTMARRAQDGATQPTTTPRGTDPQPGGGDGAEERSEARGTVTVGTGDLASILLVVQGLGGLDNDAFHRLNTALTAAVQRHFLNHEDAE